MNRWVIGLIVIGVIFILFVVGVLINVIYQLYGNAGKLQGERYILADPFATGGVSASSTKGVTIEFINGAGKDLVINSVKIEGCGTNSDGWNVKDGVSQAVTISCFLTKGERLRDDVTITYSTSGSSIMQTSTGNVNIIVRE